MCVSWVDLKTEKGHEWKNYKNPTEVYIYLTALYQRWFLNFDHCIVTV